MAVGDLILDEPDTASFFAPSAPVLKSADLVLGHVEVPHSTTTRQISTTCLPRRPIRPR